MSDINIGQLSEAINDKMDRDLNNRSNDSGLRKLVESYVNGTSWYKVFDEIQENGSIKKWCEQGGKNYCVSGQWTVISFLKVFANTNYAVTTGSEMSNSGDNPAAKISNFSTSSFDACFKWDTGQYKAGTLHWYACGYIS